SISILAPLSPPSRSSFVCSSQRIPAYCFFLFRGTAATEIYTLSLHDALPISPARLCLRGSSPKAVNTASSPWSPARELAVYTALDRKSTRLNSSHVAISYAVFCLKKKKYQQVSVRPVPAYSDRFRRRMCVGNH